MFPLIIPKKSGGIFSASGVAAEHAESEKQQHERKMVDLSVNTSWELFSVHFAKIRYIEFQECSAFSKIVQSIKKFSR